MFINTPDMHLAIFADRKISEIQEEFSQEYPFLKIEFFKNGEVRKERYPAHLMIANQFSLKEAWFKNKKEGYMNISESMTVSELENIFMDSYGLSVQVFRKSGNLWLETTMTDGWTLKQQNDHGQEISSPHKFTR